MSLWIIAFLAGLVSMGLAGWLSHPDSPIRIMDQPNERSMHSKAVPRTGGIAIVTSLIVASVYTWFVMKLPLFPAQVMTGGTIVAAVALIDDRYNVSPLIRLVVQFGAALVLVRDGFLPEGELLPSVAFTSNAYGAATVTILLTIWLTNLYNFMDGMDGFAGGMAVIGFGALAVLGWRQQELQFATSALAVCLGSAGFLWFNFPPARIFMGDTGSTTLGFLVAAFAVWASRLRVADIWVTLLVFSPFILDATVTLLRRAIQGKPLWRAHRSHYYQRLVQLGWGHRRTVLVEYAVMSACAILAIVSVDQVYTLQWLMLLLVMCSYGLAAIGVNKLEKKDRHLEHI